MYEAGCGLRSLGSFLLLSIPLEYFNWSKLVTESSIVLVRLAQLKLKLSSFLHQVY